jgi:hypothetical protein
MTGLHFLLLMASGRDLWVNKSSDCVTPNGCGRYMTTLSLDPSDLEPKKIARDSISRDERNTGKNLILVRYMLNAYLILFLACCTLFPFSPNLVKMQQL